MFVEEEIRDDRVGEGLRTLSRFDVVVTLAAHKRHCPCADSLRRSGVVAMNDAQKTLNLLERMEYLLDNVSAELRIARMDRGEVSVPSKERINTVKEAESALTACIFKRREAIEVT